MALTKCSECGREVSDKAASCPQCGAPIGLPPRAPAAQPSQTRQVATSVARIALAVIAVLVLAGAWLVNRSGRAEVPILRAARWTIDNVKANDACSTLGDYCLQVQCTVRNIGDGAGVIQLRGQLVKQDGTVAAQEEKEIRLEPGQEHAAAFDFTEAKMLGQYRAHCQAQPM